MLYPLVVSPSFILKMKDDEKYFKSFIEFYKKYRDVWTDIFVLIDDDKNTLIESYKKIYGSEIVLENPEIKNIIEYLFKLKKYKYSNIKINEKIDINNLSDFLKKNGVKKVVEFPKYFNEEFINLKNLQPKVNLYNTNYKDVIEEICSITRFSKKVFLADAMIPYSICNVQDISDIKDLSNNPDEFGFTLKRNFNFYQLGFKELIKNIYKTNFFQDELEVYIYTTLHNTKIKKIFNYTIKNYDDERLNLWNCLSNYIIESIKKCISIKIEPSAKCIKDVVVKSHFKDHIKHTDKTNYEAYDRSIFVLDMNAAIEIRKGIDLFDESTENKLRADSGYYIRNYLAEKELENARQIIEHPDYVPKKIRKPYNFQPRV